MDREVLILLNKLQERLALTERYYDSKERDTLMYSLVVSPEATSMKVVAYGQVSKYFEYKGK